jgi:phage tail-like protein
MATPANRLTSANRYRVEIDGMPQISATQATLPDVKANLHQHQAGNQRAAEYGPSTYEVSEFSFRHATGKANVDRALLEWFRAFNVDGVVDKRNARVVVFDHAGRVPLRTYELRNCCPASFKPEEHAGNSTNTAEFNFSLQPEDFDIV